MMVRYWINVALDVRLVMKIQEALAWDFIVALTLSMHLGHT